jgi:hypothetical protein
MDGFIEIIDNLVSAAQAFCDEPSLCSAVEFQAHLHQAFRIAADLKLEPRSVTRALVIARHSVGASDDVERAYKLHGTFLKPFKPRPAGDGGRAVPVRSRYQDER